MLSAKRIKIKIIFPSLPSLSAEIIANNDDLLTEILLRLPVKSLLKFKCVSKHWLFLISDPLFSGHLFPSNSPTALFLSKSFRLKDAEFDFIKLGSKHSDPPFETLDFVNDPLGIEIIQSCNGLLLCSSLQIYSPEAKYYIYNPTTKQYTVLPPLIEADEICGLYLAFNPSKTPYYNVICLFQPEISEPEFYIEIYSSKTGQWRVSAASFTLDWDIGLYGGVFWNDAIHWYTDSGPCYCIDVDQEQIKEMQMPPMPDEWNRRRVWYFGECRGHLYLVEIYNSPSTHFNVCEMERDYSGWFVKYKINLGEIVRAFPEMIRSFLDPLTFNYYVFQVMYIFKGESEDDSYLVLQIPTKIIRYNLKDKSFKKLCDFSPVGKEGASYMLHYSVYEYIESLACV